MKHLIWLALISFFLFAQPVLAGSKLEVSVSPIASIYSGTTDYTIEAATREVSEDLLDTTIVGIRSKLEFPMDGMLAGFEIGICDARQDRKRWNVNLTALINVNDPEDLMLDHDWFLYPEVGTEVKWSFTESSAKINYLLLNLEVSKAIALRPSFRLDILAGLLYNRIDWEMTGYEGWHLNENQQRHPISGTERALTYKATYKIPQVGLKMTLSSAKMSLFSLQANVGRLIASDLDDHLLRGKTAEASTTGWAFSTQAQGKFLLPQSGSTRPFVFARIGYSTQSASGSQTQTWYKDEPYIDFNGEPQIQPAGSSISGIPYKTSSHQLRIGFGFGLAF